MRRSDTSRKNWLPGTLRRIAAGLLCLNLAACGGSPEKRADPKRDEINPQPLVPDEVNAIMQAAARAIDRDAAIAVTDRRGVILGVGTKGSGGADFAVNYTIDCAPARCPATEVTPRFGCEDCAVVNRAVQLARTASFFSADQTPLTSRAIRFLSGEHFPSGIKNTGAAALFGIENTNRGCAFDGRTDFSLVVPPARSLFARLSDGNDGAILCQNGIETPPQSGTFIADPTALRGCTTGIATVPGGVPIYKNGRMAGGVGVFLRSTQLAPDPVAAFDNADILRRTDVNADFVLAEFAARAYAGDNTGFTTVAAKGLRGVCDGPQAPACCHPTNGDAPCVLNILPARQLPFDPVIFIDGIEIPEVAQNLSVSGVGTGQAITSFIVNPLDPQMLQTTDLSSCVKDTPCVLNCTEQQACPVASQWLVGPMASSDGLLSQSDVQNIINSGISAAEATRGGIRLPLEARAAMVLAVSDKNGKLLGLFRMPDATVFSIDVAVAKSRNVIYFSDPAETTTLDTMDCPGEGDCREQAFPRGTAITNRTLSFGSQPFFPSGIEATDDTRYPGFPLPFAPGPFRRVFIDDSLTPCTNGQQTANGRQNGIVFFPGSAPLYRNGVLVGGFGVSGDGVEQDDIVTIAGTQAAPGFEPAAAIRADQVFVRGVRLPYVKFNRQPQQ